MTRKEQIKAQWTRLRWRRVQRLLDETTSYLSCQGDEEQGEFLRELQELADYVRNRATAPLEG